jgi:hypothetical protein
MGSEAQSDCTRHCSQYAPYTARQTTENLTAFDASFTVLALPGGKMGKTAVYETLNTRPITKVSLLLLHLLIFLERFTGRERPKTNTNSAGK